ncbi:MarR family transcriptional regulator [Paenibacillus sp. MBLB2552]|uniref:MarR family transcriptional regulator n=1 Tax=Paenibacillus mellifer TaxID=2937794 RepID=A0A9X2BMP3_9BACL|nr:MarR family transcriptional regulator [Paenibacillus mellifer]MCK8485929.1 MarR family transcriptional regulator [Paenibacillus mellifer]
MADSLFDLVLDNFKKIFYPEEWLALDMQFSKAELFALLLVDKHGDITMSQLASSMNVPMSTATGVIERLVKNGYIVRVKSETDRRIVTIRLTGKGTSLSEELKDTLRRLTDLLVQGLSEEEQRLLVQIFLKVLDNLSRTASKPASDHESEAAANPLTKIEIE